jgi:hypothetical protein
VNTEITCFSIIDKYVVIGTDDGQYVGEMLLPLLARRSLLLCSLS